MWPKSNRIEISSSEISIFLQQENICLIPPTQGSLQARGQNTRVCLTTSGEIINYIIIFIFKKSPGKILKFTKKCAFLKFSLDNENQKSGLVMPPWLIQSLSFTKKILPEMYSVTSHEFRMGKAFSATLFIYENSKTFPFSKGFLC